MVATVASRELRNDTAGVLRRVQTGEELVVTVRGEPVAELVPLRSEQPKSWFSRDELVDLLTTSSADPGLRDDLDLLAGDTTDDVPIP